MLKTKVQKREKSGQLTITIPKDFAIFNKIDKGLELEFMIATGEFNLETGDIILRRCKE